LALWQSPAILEPAEAEFFSPAPLNPFTSPIRH
jgi:hypothetical protein